MRACRKMQYFYYSFFLALFQKFFVCKCLRHKKRSVSRTFLEKRISLIMVDLKGFEPTTLRMRTVRSRAWYTTSPKTSPYCCRISKLREKSMYLAENYSHLPYPDIFLHYILGYEVRQQPSSYFYNFFRGMQSTHWSSIALTYPSSCHSPARYPALRPARYRPLGAAPRIAS